MAAGAAISDFVSGMPYLLTAANSDFVSRISYLLTAADNDRFAIDVVTPLDSQGRTLLHYACALYSFSAISTSSSSENFTKLQQELVREGFSHALFTITPIGAREGSLLEFLLFLERKVTAARVFSGMLQQDKLGNTPLHYLARSGDMQSLLLYLNREGMQVLLRIPKNLEALQAGFVVQNHQAWTVGHMLVRYRRMSFIVHYLAYIAAAKLNPPPPTGLAAAVSSVGSAFWAMIAPASITSVSSAKQSLFGAVTGKGVSAQSFLELCLANPHEIFEELYFYLQKEDPVALECALAGMRAQGHQTLLHLLMKSQSRQLRGFLSKLLSKYDGAAAETFVPTATTATQLEKQLALAFPTPAETCSLLTTAAQHQNENFLVLADFIARYSPYWLLELFTPLDATGATPLSEAFKRQALSDLLAFLSLPFTEELRKAFIAVSMAKDSNHALILIAAKRDYRLFLSLWRFIKTNVSSESFRLFIATSPVLHYLIKYDDVTDFEVAEFFRGVLTKDELLSLDLARGMLITGDRLDAVAPALGNSLIDRLFKNRNQRGRISISSMLDCGALEVLKRLPRERVQAVLIQDTAVGKHSPLIYALRHQDSTALLALLDYLDVEVPEVLTAICSDSELLARLLVAIFECQYNAPQVLEFFWDLVIRHQPEKLEVALKVSVPLISTPARSGSLLELLGAVLMKPPSSINELLRFAVNLVSLIQCNFPECYREFEEKYPFLLFLTASSPSLVSKLALAPVSESYGSSLTITRAGDKGKNALHLLMGSAASNYAAGATLQAMRGLAREALKAALFMKDDFGQNPLHAALVAGGNENFISLLRFARTVLKFTADEFSSWIFAPDNMRMTPADLAIAVLFSEQLIMFFNTLSIEDKKILLGARKNAHGQTALCAVVPSDDKIKKCNTLVMQALRLGVLEEMLGARAQVVFEPHSVSDLSARVLADARGVTPLVVSCALKKRFELFLALANCSSVDSRSLLGDGGSASPLALLFSCLELFYVLHVIKSIPTERFKDLLLSIDLRGKGPLDVLLDRFSTPATGELDLILEYILDRALVGQSDQKVVNEVLCAPSGLRLLECILKNVFQNTSRSQSLQRKVYEKFYRALSPETFLYMLRQASLRVDFRVGAGAGAGAGVASLPLFFLLLESVHRNGFYNLPFKKKDEVFKEFFARAALARPIVSDGGALVSLLHTALSVPGLGPVAPLVYAIQNYSFSSSPETNAVLDMVRLLLVVGATFPEGFVSRLEPQVQRLALTDVVAKAQKNIGDGLWFRRGSAVVAWVNERAIK
jgi:ankyrin repeat protein